MSKKENAYVAGSSATGEGDKLDFVKQTPLVCPGHSRGVVELNYSPETPDGVFLLSACQDKLPMLRSAATGDWIGTFEGHKGAVWNAHLDPTAHRAATASADFTARVWDAITGDELYQFEHPSVVKAARLSRNAQTLLTGGYDKKLRLYDLQKPEAAPTVLEGHTGRVSKAVFLGAQESTILSVGDDETCIKVWDRRTGAVAQSLATGENATDVEISEDGATLTVSAKDSVQFWDAKTLTQRAAHKMSDYGLQCASLHPDGTRFVTGGYDMSVRVYTAEGVLMEEHRSHHGPVWCVRFAPGGASYASGADDATVRIWQTVPKAAEQ